MTHYYIIDHIANEEEGEDYITETSEKEFYESMHDNWQVAKECGDEVPAYRTMMKETRNEPDHEEMFNAFSFLKLTTMTPEEWGYTS